MQASKVEYCRSILKRPNAHSSESKEELVEDIEDASMCMLEGDWERLEGTLRLGLRETALCEGSIAHKYYGHDKVNERHWHRYEVNSAVVPDLEAAGLHFDG